MLTLSQLLPDMEVAFANANNEDILNECSPNSLRF
jgi:hypothetical protein